MHGRSEIVRVEGMTCASCEARVAEALRSLPGVAGVAADAGRGDAELRYGEGPSRPARTEIAAALEGAGYRLAEGRDAGPGLGLAAGLLLALAYLAADRAGLFAAIPEAASGAGYGALLLLGLLTSLHCVAMCGGIALGQSIGRGGAPAARLGPALLYNLGRLVSYGLVGAFAGGLGQLAGFSPRAKAILMGLAALAMLAYGLRALGLLRLPLPRRRVRAGLGAAASRLVAGKGPLIAGLANGLMPCGPLQSMQLLALGTGSAAAGALSMLAFGLGTVPLMLGLGALAGLVPRRLIPIAARASGVLVLAFGLATAGRAAALAGIAIPSPFEARPVSALPAGARGEEPLILAASLGSALRAAATAPAGAEGSYRVPVQSKDSVDGPIRAVVEGGVQRVVTEIGPRSYPSIAVKAGIPLRWTIRARPGTLNGCNNAIVVPAYRIQARLKVGDTIVEFTPEREGIIAFSCWMGMIRSRIVVEK